MTAKFKSNKTLEENLFMKENEEFIVCSYRSENLLFELSLQICFEKKKLQLFGWA